MAGMIPREFIDQLLTRCDIVEVINARVPLKRHGREYQACCPFHNEKTPSFTVSPNKQFYHCFGCGAHGSAISFLMEYEHLEFVEAVESLASSLGLEVPREQGKKHNPQTQLRNKSLLDLMEDACRYYQSQLKRHAGAVEYLKNRGLSGEIAQTYGLGYSQKSWDAVITHLSSRYRPEQIVESGLAIAKDEGGSYDRYRDRIMFPIRNRKGQVIGFGGRVMGEDTPKYINSPETSLFHKGSELYGLYEARHATRKLERIVVVEGYMDVISLAQFGVTYAVATLGTATTQQHIEILYRAVPEIVFCFDGDRAGKEAAWRALENTLPILRDDKAISFLFLPQGEDPDTLVRRVGKEAFEQLMVDATSLSRYFLQALEEQFNIHSNEGKARFINRANELLKKVPESLLKDQLVQDIAKLTGVEVSTIIKRQSRDHDIPLAVKSRNHIYQRSVTHPPVRYACILLLNKPSLVNLVESPEKIAFTDLPGTDLLATLIESIEESPHISAVTLLERWRYSGLEPELIQLMKWQPSSDDDDVLTREFLDCLASIDKQSRQRQLEKLLHKESTGGLSEQEKGDMRFLSSQLSKQ
ncbi:MAG: DNA primase [Proteobacteria bacterium]|nr:MAG: DNA primase [Pseudomonadota bacterium]